MLLACKVDQQRELRLAPGRLIAAIDMLSENISARVLVDPDVLIKACRTQVDKELVIGRPEIPYTKPNSAVNTEGLLSPSCACTKILKDHKACWSASAHTQCSQGLVQALLGESQESSLAQLLLQPRLRSREHPQNVDLQTKSGNDASGTYILGFKAIRRLLS